MSENLNVEQGHGGRCRLLRVRIALPIPLSKNWYMSKKNACVTIIRNWYMSKKKKNIENPLAVYSIPQRRKG